MLGDFAENYINSCGEAEEIMIDIMAKRISTSKRQILYLFYIILRYLKIKENPRSLGNTGKILYIMSGRAPHTHLEGKKIIEAIYKLKKIINPDPVAQNFMKLLFVPNFNVAMCELYVAAGDLS